MLKYLQTKMFHVGNNPTMDQKQFGDFRSCLSIFNNSTKLQKNRKRKKTRKEGLTWRLQPGPPAGPAQRRASELLAGQAGRQGARRRAPHGCHAPARRLAAPLTRLTPWIDPSLPRTPQTSPLLSSSSHSRSPAMADATAAAPSP